MTIECANRLGGKEHRVIWVEKEINAGEVGIQQARNIFQNVFYKEKRKRKQNFSGLKSQEKDSPLKWTIFKW